MCLAIPGKIIKINKNIAEVEYPDGIKQAKIYTGQYKEGDYVIVQANMVIEKVPKKQVKEWDKFLKS